ncbi:carbohydrate ABC transporter permease [Butyrivibrio sp. AE2015]|uniref:carbohydrate ABC transporter permease n=1 Tax=Butyrivibrio sp. AE2015 TaxID=1280663 RepID=UPI0003B6A8E6|nr:carbohydrate ABC transporter permease [Butyrivibrio sp. AE2015]
MKKKIEPFEVIVSIFMILISLICIFPFIYVLAGSLNEGMDYMRGGIYFFPRKLSFDNYRMVFNDKRLLIGIKNTCLRTVIGTVTGTYFTALVAYGMSRKDLIFRKQIYWFNIFTMFFGGGMIPTYLVFSKLHLINSFLVYIIPSLYSVFNMIIFSNFYNEIPEEIHEAGAIDGASEWQIFYKLYLPSSGPVLATIALWIGVFHWNSFFDSMVYTSNSNLQTLQLFLVKLIKEASMAEGEAATKVPAQVVRTTSITTIRYAAIVINMLPVLFVFPFVQKYLSKGVIIGAVKG